MYWNRSPAEIYHSWQNEIETKLEAGAVPLLDTGLGDATLSRTAVLLALQELNDRRVDVSTPLLSVGGNDAVWPAVLLMPKINQQPATAPATRVLYTGADAATHLVSMALIPVERTLPSVTSSWTTDRALRRYFAPKVAPGSSAPLSSLPFLELAPQPAPGIDDYTAPEGSMIDWVAWGCMLLALALLLLALFV